MTKENKETYVVRFWNEANECIWVGGKYGHEFNTYSDAWNAANALLIAAHNSGAVEVDINNEFFQILDD